MELLMLGPFTAVHRGRSVHLGRRQERCVLGVLALEPRQPVSIDRLLDLLWEGHGVPPARSTIHTYVARLRAALRPYGVEITSRQAGYTVSGEFTTDVERFTELAAEGDAAVDARVRAARYGSALALWRGDLLADVVGPHLRDRLSSHLDEHCLRCVEGRAEALIEIGRSKDVIIEFAGTAEAHPHREHLAALLMSAYHRENRQAEALDLHRSVRMYLADELGVDPGPEIRSVYARILRGDEPSAVDAGAASTAVDLLPRSIAGFVGRDDHLAALDRIAADTALASPVAVISALTGTPGVGKTALAVHWAHQVKPDAFDLRLYIDLQGYGPTAPLSPVDALTHLLRALGVEAGDLPDDLAAATARYRAEVARARTLVVLDNARSVDQVRPLLPPATGSLTIVTSRDRLSGLIAIDGAVRVAVDVLTVDEATHLLTAIIGAGRAAAEPGAVRALADICGRLPLALRIAAATLVDDEIVTIGDHVDRLSTARLAQLEIDGDAKHGVRAVFDDSYQQLSVPAQRMFRLLGSAPGTDIGVPAAAALAGSTPAETAALLDRLCAAHMLTEHTEGRYQMHDLLGEYAKELTDVPEIHDALDRLLSWFGAHAAAVNVVLSPDWTPPEWVDRNIDVPPFPDITTAFAWMKREGASMLAGTMLAEDDHPEWCWRLIGVMAQWIQRQRPSREFVTVTAAAVRASVVSRPPLARYQANTAHAIALIYAGRPTDAVPHFEEALRAIRETDEVRLVLTALQNLGGALSETGRLSEAVEYLEEAVTILDATAGLEHMIPRILVNIGYTRADTEEAVVAFERSVAAALRHGNDVDIATSATSLAAPLIKLGRYDEAHHAATLAQEHANRAEHRLMQARAQDNLGRIAYHRGEITTAREYIALALAGYAEVQPTAIAEMKDLTDRLGLSSSPASDGR